MSVGGNVPLGEGIPLAARASSYPSSNMRWATDESSYRNPTPINVGRNVPLGEGIGLTKIGDSIVKGAPATPTATTIRKNPSSQTRKEWINKYSKEYGLDPSLITAQMGAESGYRHYNSAGDILTSSKDAQGSMQLKELAAKDTGVDRKDPESNVLGGIKYMAQMMKRFNNNTVAALAAYNWGPTNLSSWLKTHTLPKDFSHLPSATKKYIETILDGVEKSKSTRFPPR